MSVNTVKVAENEVNETSEILLAVPLYLKRYFPATVSAGISHSRLTTEYMIFILNKIVKYIF